MCEIRFYRTNDEYGNFSNFAPFPIFCDGETWLTVEHYFQAQKFLEDGIRNKIREMKFPYDAAKEGRNPENILRNDWELIKEQVMYKALLCKFKQHPDLRRELLSTYNLPIIEHTENDKYWGNGGNDSGKNRLGVLLMEVRKELINISSDPNIILPPWIAFPSLESEDMFWRMGLGENYIYKWSRYYLSIDNKIEYQIKFPELPNWQGTY